MKINITEFLKPEDVVVPFISGIGYHGSRKLRINVSDGWYKIRLTDEIEEVAPADTIDVLETVKNIPKYSGYIFNQEFIPNHVNSFKARTGITSMSVPIYFNTAVTWSVASAVMWRDHLIFIDLDMTYKKLELLLELKEKFEKEEQISGMRGITPEMRYLYFLTLFERDSLREIEHLRQLAISEEEKRKRLEEFRKSTAGRLKETIERAGGNLERFYRQGNDKLVVVWTVDGEQLESVIRTDTFQCIEAGFCVSGDDDKLNITAAVLTAKDHIDREVLYKTRGRW
jgi:hypothetical protein